MRPELAVFDQVHAVERARQQPFAERLELLQHAERRDLGDERLAELREEARKRNDAEGLARLVLRARQSGALALARPVRVFLSWAHPEASLELRVAAPGEGLGPPSDLAPQFGLLGWHSTKEQPPGESFAIEVQRTDSSLAGSYPAQLVVITSEGEAGEKLWQVPLQLDAAHKTVRLTLRQNQLNVEKQ